VVGKHGGPGGEERVRVVCRWRLADYAAEIVQQALAGIRGGGAAAGNPMAAMANAMAGRGGGGASRAAPAAPAQPVAPAASAQPRARALYDYPGQTPDELSFREGDVITIHKKDPGGWWEGELNGQRGWIPANYVQEM